MGISVEQYRFRIGIYLPSVPRKLVDNFGQNSTNYAWKFPCKSMFSVILKIALISIIILSQQQFNKQVGSELNLSFKLSTNLDSYLASLTIKQVSSYKKLSNFSARYTYGNRSTRGMKVAHFNKGCGYLATKMQDIESLIADLRPHVIGISEANLFKSHELNSVQIDDYVLHKCPTYENPNLLYSRIVVYCHKSLVCKPRPDLMDESCSSIWIQVGLPRQKQILICQVYREWQLLGQQNDSSKSLEAQLNRWGGLH